MRGTCFFGIYSCRQSCSQRVDAALRAASTLWDCLNTSGESYIKLTEAIFPNPLVFDIIQASRSLDAIGLNGLIESIDTIASSGVCTQE